MPDASQTGHSRGVNLKPDTQKRHRFMMKCQHFSFNSRSVFVKFPHGCSMNQTAFAQAAPDGSAGRTLRSELATGDHGFLLAATRTIDIDPQDAQHFVVGTPDGTLAGWRGELTQLKNFSRPALHRPLSIREIRRRSYVAAHRHKESGGSLKSTDGRRRGANQRNFARRLCTQ